jgi:hypothetical protein
MRLNETLLITVGRSEAPQEFLPFHNFESILANRHNGITALTMATAIGTLPRITATALSTIILAQSSSPNPSVAIIDVRDDGMSPSGSPPL